MDQEQSLTDLPAGLMYGIELILNIYWCYLHVKHYNYALTRVGIEIGRRNLMAITNYKLLYAFLSILYFKHIWYNLSTQELWFMNFALLSLLWSCGFVTSVPLWSIFAYKPYYSVTNYIVEWQHIGFYGVAMCRGFGLDTRPGTM